MPNVRVLVLATAMACGTVACGSSKATDAAATTVAPESLRATDADVAKGLRALQTTAAGIASVAADKSKAAALVEELEPAWQPIEGTVKANDSATYLAIEDAFALLEKGAAAGDAAKAQQGADAVAKAVATYLAAHPA